MEFTDRSASGEKDRDGLEEWDEMPAAGKKSQIMKVMQGVATSMDSDTNRIRGRSLPSVKMVGYGTSSTYIKCFLSSPNLTP